VQARPSGESHRFWHRVIDSTPRPAKTVGRCRRLLLSRTRFPADRRSKIPAFYLRCRVSPRPSSSALRARCAAMALCMLVGAGVTTRAQGSSAAGTPQRAEARQSQETHDVQRRIPRQQALLTAGLDGIVHGSAAGSGEARAVAGARIVLKNLQSGHAISDTANAEGVFRVVSIPPGHYAFGVEAEGFAPFMI